MLHTPPQLGHFLFHQETNPNARPPEQLSNVCLFDEDKIYFFWSFSSWRSFFLFSLMFSQHKPETKSCSVLKHSTHIRKEILCIEGSLEECASFANLGSLPCLSFSSLLLSTYYTWSPLIVRGFGSEPCTCYCEKDMALENVMLFTKCYHFY